MSSHKFGKLELFREVRPLKELATCHAISVPEQKEEIEIDFCLLTETLFTKQSPKLSDYKVYQMNYLDIYGGSAVIIRQNIARYYELTMRSNLPSKDFIQHCKIS